MKKSVLSESVFAKKIIETAGEVRSLFLFWTNSFVRWILILSQARNPCIKIYYYEKQYNNNLEYPFVQTAPDI